LSSANHKKKMFLLLQRGGLIVITFAWNHMFEPYLIYHIKEHHFYTIFPLFQNIRENWSKKYEAKSLHIGVIHIIITKPRVNDNPKENYDIIMLY
jgi:hypothetical protein